MDINEILGIALPAVFIIVGIALIVFLVELIKTMKVARTTIVDIKKQTDPTLANVEQITTDLTPALAKVEPLMDRVQLTIDTVNLEMMRVDQILENVSEISDTASSAVAAVDNVTNAPINLVNNMATKVKGVLKPKNASDETLKLEEQRVAIGKALEDYKVAEEKAAKADKAAVSDLDIAAPEPIEESEQPTGEIPVIADSEQPTGEMPAIVDDKPEQAPAVKPGYFTYDEKAEGEKPAE